MVGSYAIGEEKEKAEKWRDEISEREGREREREREREIERERKREIEIDRESECVFV